VTQPTGRSTGKRVRAAARAAAEAPREVDVPERGPGGRWPVPERSMIATVLGVPPLLAVAVAAALTTLGVVVDLLRIGTLGTPFTVCYLTGCVLAVAWVRRRGLFGPVVQPPLLLAVAVPVVVLLAGSPRPGTGISERLLTIGAPLVNSFPTMAWTTAAVIALGTGRLLVQRESVEAARPPGGRRSLSGRSARAAARGEARRSASPERS
jgi:hypothetical protein